MNLAGAKQLGIHFDVFIHHFGNVAAGRHQTQALQHFDDKFVNAVRFAGGDDVIVGLLLLQHGVHGADVIAGVSPIATGLHVAQLQLALLALRPISRRQGDLAGHHLGAAARGLMIKQNAADRENSTLAVDATQTVSGGLGNSIRRGGSQCRLLIAQAVLIAIHFRTGSLVDARIRPLALDDVQQARQAANIDVEGLGRNLPAGRDENLTRKVINFVR